MVKNRFVCDFDEFAQSVQWLTSAILFTTAKQNEKVGELHRGMLRLTLWKFLTTIAEPGDHQAETALEATRILIRKAPFPEDMQELAIAELEDIFKEMSFRHITDDFDFLKGIRDQNT